MKRIVNFLLVLTILAGVTACSESVDTQSEPQVPTWQEQYDLGVRYLEEGNYEEAIIAFTAAIEIDPKQDLAYVGRGDAYIGLGETEENLAAAQADYEVAIDLDDTLAEAYLGIADVYIRRGDSENALAILRIGLENAPNNQEIAEKIAELEIAETDSKSIETVGEFFLIREVYNDRYQDVFSGYENYMTFSAMCGVKFLAPVSVDIGGEVVSITEAELYYPQAISDTSLLSSYVGGTHLPGPLIGKQLLLKGYFSLNDQQNEVEGPFFVDPDGRPSDFPIYNWQPIGPYVFHLTNYSEA